jgi:hypothetical protein
MNTRAIGYSMAVIATLVTSNAFAPNTLHASQISTSVMQQSTDSEQVQRTTIELSTTDLKANHVLKVSAPLDTKLNGKITINGRVVKQFGNQGTAINLSPYLSRGRQTIEVSGRYMPVDSLVELTFSGPETQVSQQTGGDGVVKQTLVIDIR